jgi:hypothetical protein
MGMSTSECKSLSMQDFQVLIPFDRVGAGSDSGAQPPQPSPAPPREIGGPGGPEPTRFGDWEKNGRCIDF